MYSIPLLVLHPITIPLPPRWILMNILRLCLISASQLPISQILYLDTLLSFDILPLHHLVQWQARSSRPKNHEVPSRPWCHRSMWFPVSVISCPPRRQWKVLMQRVWDLCWLNFTWAAMTTVIAITLQRYDTCIQAIISNMQPYAFLQIRLIILICNHKTHVESARDLILHLSSPYFSEITFIVADLKPTPILSTIRGLSTNDVPLWRLATLLDECWMDKDVFNALAEILPSGRSYTSNLPINSSPVAFTSACS